MTNKLSDLIQQRIAADDKIKAGKAELDEANKEILEELQNQDRKKFEDTNGSATIIQPRAKDSYDWAKLKKIVGQLVWNRITVQVPSEDLIERAVAEGAISPDTLGQCLVQGEERAPYIKVAKPKV